jgi:hypothetical protein
MAKVFVHYRNPSSEFAVNEVFDFERIPVVGEYVALEPIDKNSARDSGRAEQQWYKVTLVVHSPQTELHAELYAIRVDHLEEVKKADHG